MEISQQKFCLVGAFICHKKAGDDACAHLDCIKKTGKCLHAAGLRLHHLPDNVVSTEQYHLLSKPGLLSVIQFKSFHWLSHQRIRAIIPCSTNRISVRRSFLIYIWGLFKFSIKQLSHSRLLDMR